MPHVSLNGVELFYEVTGTGFPVVFCHEFAGDYRSWNPQVSWFARSFQCVTYSYRGFPPSSVPEMPDAYSQELLIDDLHALLQHLGITESYLVGFSMGGSLVVNFAVRYPELCRGVVAVGTGTGTTDRERFERDVQEVVQLLDTQGIAAFANVYAEGPSRQPLKRKDPRSWTEFREHLAQHSPVGQSLTMQGVQLARPTIFAIKDQLNQLRVPTLVMAGDEDEACVEPSLFMKRQIPSSGLAFFPQSGHAVNLEEPALFNQLVGDFFHLVESGRWAVRSVDSRTASLMPAAASD